MPLFLYFRTHNKEQHTMVLNYIWIAFFVISFVIALGKLIFMGDTTVFTEMMTASTTSAKNAFELSLGLTGVLFFVVCAKIQKRQQTSKIYQACLNILQRVQTVFKVYLKNINKRAR